MVITLTISGSVFAETGKRGNIESVRQGKVLYESYCIACHKKDGIGEVMIPWGIRKPGYRIAIPLNETSHAWHHSDEQLIKMILEGVPGNNRMPAHKNILSKTVAGHLVSYIKSLWSDKILACQGPKHMSCMH